MSKFRNSLFGGSKSAKQEKDVVIVSEQAWSPGSEAMSPSPPKEKSVDKKAMNSPTSVHSTGFQFPVREKAPPDYSEQPTQGVAQLKALADRFGISLYPGLPKIESKEKAPSYLKADSTKSAEKLLNSRRTSDPDYKAPSGMSKLMKSKAKMAEFSYKEVNRALNDVVRQNGALDLVEALLDMGGDVDVARRASSNMWKKVTSKNQEEQKSEVVQTAARYGSTELVQLLAARAGPYTLAESLEISVQQDDINKVRVLLEFDASITQAHDVFKDAVKQGNEEIVQLLLAGRNPPCQDCRAAALPLAVARASTHIVGALAATGADANHNEAEAVRAAASCGRYDLALLAALSSNPATIFNLDAAADLAWINLPDRDVQLRTLEVCLCAGATGQHTEVLLQLGAEQDDLDLTTLLLSYGISIDRDGGKALCIAIENEHQSIFDALMEKGMNATTLGNGLVNASIARNLGLSFTHKLLQKGASAAFENGKPMVAAVMASRNDILPVLVQSQPSRPALSAALLAGVSLVGDARLTVLGILLAVAHDQDTMDSALICLAGETPPDHSAMMSLLSAGAAPDAQDGRATAIVACNFDHSTLELLKPYVVSSTWVYSQAAIAVISNPTWLEPEGLGTLQYLLENGAQPSAIEEAVVDAAIKFDLQALQFLSDWITTTEVYTVAFAEVVALDERWLNDDNFGIIELLLEKGANGEVVDNTLLMAVDAFLKGRTQEILIDRLLQYNADVNHEEGHALEMAVRAGSVALLEKLYQYGPSEWSMSLALTTALTCQLPANEVVDVVISLTSTQGHNADPNFVVAGLDPLLYLGLQNYPTSVPVISTLCQIGCDVNAEIQYQVYGEAQPTPDQWHSDAWLSIVQSQRTAPQIEWEPESADSGALVLCDCQECRDARGQSDAAEAEVSRQLAILDDGARQRLRHEEEGLPTEKVTPLLWACCQLEDTAVSTPVIEVLLQYKANINYMTSVSRSTALLLACRYHKPDFVKVLTASKPEISVKDKFNRTPLFYAAGNGDTKTVRILIQAKARVNDGSLHEATREIHPEVVQMLVKSGHDPNFSSTKHGGLTPLGELCMYGDGNGLGGKIDDCIDMLVKARLDPMKKWHGKTLLHMALENPVPFPVTSALLERLMYKYVTNDANVYHYKGLNYSPTMALVKGNFIGTPGDCQALISLLKSNGAVDVYYADEGSVQPSDAVGMPKVILEAERRRIRHETDLRYKMEKDLAELRAAQVKHEQYMEHQEERFQQQYYHKQALNMQDIEHKQKQAAIKLESERHTLAFKERGLQIEAATQHVKVAGKQQMNALNRSDRRDQQAHKLNMNRMAMQKANIDARARSVRNAQDAQHDFRKRAHANWMAQRRRYR